MPPCPRCARAEVQKDDTVGAAQRDRCRGCRRTFSDRTGIPFAGYRWPQGSIGMAVRWSLR